MLLTVVFAIDADCLCEQRRVVNHTNEGVALTTIPKTLTPPLAFTKAFETHRNPHGDHHVGQSLGESTGRLSWAMLRRHPMQSPHHYQRRIAIMAGDGPFRRAVTCARWYGYVAWCNIRAAFHPGSLPVRNRFDSWIGCLQRQRLGQVGASLIRRPAPQSTAISDK